MPVKKGDTVTVAYHGTFDNGEVFDSSENHGQNLTFEVGAGQVVPGFDAAMEGMEVGETKQIHIEPEYAYGPHKADLQHEIPREQLPMDRQLQPGMKLMASLPNGMQMPVQIASVTPEIVTIDLNHPLAGKALNFRIKLISVK